MRIAIIRSGAIGLAILVTVAASDASHSGLNAAAGAVQGYRTVFVITAAVSLASVIIAALLPAKPKPVPAPPPPSEGTSSNDHHTAHADVRESLNGQAAPDCPFLRTRPGHVGRGEAEPGASRRQVRRVAGRSSAHGEQGRCHRPPRWTALHQRSRAGHSFDVHRVLHLASTIGLADQLLGDLQRTLFSGRANVYDHAVLADASSHLGIPRRRIEEVLSSNEYAHAVRADEREAKALGATGVPFTVFDGRIAIPGATSIEHHRHHPDRNLRILRCRNRRMHHHRNRFSRLGGRCR